MHRKKLWFGFIVVIIGLLCTLIYLLVKPAPVVSPPENIEIIENSTNKDESLEPEEPKPTLLNVQPIIDAWGAKQSGEFSIVVYDLENEKTIGSHRENEIYFAASIYKLYVAYEGYLAEQRGEYKFDEPYLNGQTRETCLDLMIRESDSPCAEKLWNELGKEKLTSTLVSYGINNTSMTNINTTAQDAATLLARLHLNDEMNVANKNRMLTSMKHQVYRDSLAKGLSSGIFYDKVGFRGYDEYHDVGILELPNGRHYVISLLTNKVGTIAMTELGQQLYDVLSVVEAE